MCDRTGAVAQELAVLGEVGRVCTGVHGEEVIVNECFGFDGVSGWGGWWVFCNAIRGTGVHPAAGEGGWVLGLGIECFSFLPGLDSLFLRLMGDEDIGVIVRAKHCSKERQVGLHAFHQLQQLVGAYEQVLSSIFVCRHCLISNVEGSGG